MERCFNLEETTFDTFNQYCKEADEEMERSMHSSGGLKRLFII